MRIPWHRIDWLNTVFLIVVHVTAVAGTALYASLHGFTWAAVAIGVALGAASGMSITAGYHRLFAHGTYRAHPALRAFYLLFGSAAFQKSALKWCGDHRRHHTYTDREEDPYNIRRGFLWAHMGWILFREPGNLPVTHVTDLERDPLVRIQHRFYFSIATVVGFGLPLALGFLAGDPWGGFIVGGFLRLVCLYQATFCVNSVAHALGTQPYSDRYSARDSALTAFITLGEGYHNYHHAFPFDYRNGVRAWHFDPSKWLIRVMSFLGLTRDLVRAPRELILKARLRMQERHATSKHPQAAELLRAARVKMESLLDRWAALKVQVADLRSRFDRGSHEALESLRREVRETWSAFREARGLWFRALRRPEILATPA